MRVLILGNSNDTGRYFDGGPKRHEIVRDLLAKEFGEPVEVVAKSLWPTERMPTVVDGWMREYQPDLVYLNIVSYWFSYESVPLRVKRIFGRVGAPFANAGAGMARDARWSHNAVFRGLRKAAQATIGGDPNFATADVIERIGDTIRTVIRHEGVVLVVKGSRGLSKGGFDPRAQRRKEARRIQVHRAIGPLCGQLHVRYVGSETPLWKTEKRPKGTRAGDGLHSNAKGHELGGDRLFGMLSEAWGDHIREQGAGDAKPLRRPAPAAVLQK